MIANEMLCIEVAKVEQYRFSPKGLIMEGTQSKRFLVGETVAEKLVFQTRANEAASRGR